MGEDAGEVVQISVGRTVAYAQIGDPDGTPVVRPAWDPRVRA